jgi:hypothetical protein
METKKQLYNIIKQYIPRVKDCRFEEQKAEYIRQKLIAEIEALYSQPQPFYPVKEMK